MKSLVLKFIMPVIAIAIATGCSDDFNVPETPSGSTINVLISEDENFEILEAALVKTGLSGFLDDNNSGTFTLFAPTDAAFLTYLQSVFVSTPPADDAAAVALIGTLTNTSSPLNLGTLTQRLNYHMVSSEITLASITGSASYTTLSTPSGTSGQARLSLSKSGSDIVINANSASNGATIIEAERDASNGLLIPINRVINPPTTSTVLSIVGITGVNYATNPATITGGSETGGDATGTDYDILAYALRRADLVTTLQPNTSPLPDFTLFAPTDDAFRNYFGGAGVATPALENAAIQSVKAMDVNELANLLKYHVISGRILTSDLSAGQTLTTLSGTTIEIDINTSGPTPVYTLIDKNGAADPVISNSNNLSNAGVLQRIDKVLRPE